MVLGDLISDFLGQPRACKLLVSQHCQCPAFRYREPLRHHHPHLVNAFPVTAWSLSIRDHSAYELRAISSGAQINMGLANIPHLLACSGRGRMLLSHVMADNSPASLKLSSCKSGHDFVHFLLACQTRFCDFFFSFQIHNRPRCTI